MSNLYGGGDAGTRIPSLDLCLGGHPLDPAGTEGCLALVPSAAPSEMDGAFPAMMRLPGAGSLWRVPESGMADVCGVHEARSAGFG